jgi:large subunit ribosomal protein L7A
MPERLRSARNRCVGTKQTLKAVETGRAIVVYLAQDADPKVTGQVAAKALECGVEVVRVASMKDLGKMCGIEVGAAAAAVLTA